MGGLNGNVRKLLYILSTNYNFSKLFTAISKASKNSSGSGSKFSLNFQFAGFILLIKHNLNVLSRLDQQCFVIYLVHRKFSKSLQFSLPIFLSSNIFCWQSSRVFQYYNLGVHEATKGYIIKSYWGIKKIVKNVNFCFFKYLKYKC